MDFLVCKSLSCKKTWHQETTSTSKHLTTSQWAQDIKFTAKCKGSNLKSCNMIMNYKVLKEFPPNG